MLPPKALVLLLQMKYFADTLTAFDPGLLAAKRSLKTFLAILISLLIYHHQPKMALLAVIAAMLFSRSQTGATIRERKFSMLLTGLLMTALSVPVSLISANTALSVVFVTVFAFFVFFFIGLKLVPDFPAVVVLSISVVEMAFSRTFESGLRYAGLFLLITFLVYILHFIIFPTRPRKRLEFQIGFIIKNLENYYGQIAAHHPDIEKGIAATQRTGAGVRRSINDFNRLWQLFRVSAAGEETPEGRMMRITLGLQKLYDYLVMLWQFRAHVWDSGIYRKNILDAPLFHEIVQSVLTYLHPDTRILGDHHLRKLQNRLQEYQAQSFESYQDSDRSADRVEWVAVFNTLNTLNAILEDMLTLSPSPVAEMPDFTIKAKAGAFLAKLRKTGYKFRRSSPAFRFGLRSAIIIGFTQFFYRYFEPDYGYWLVLFAVLLIRPNLGISIKNGRDRLLGTIAGSAIAAGFLLLVQPGDYLFYAGLFAAVFLMIWFINLDKYVYMVVALTVVILATFSLIYAGQEQLALLRTAYTAAIVLVVIAGSFLLWPERARKKLARSLADALEHEKIYFRLIINTARGNPEHAQLTIRKSLLEQQLVQLDEVMSAASSEVLQTKVLSHGFRIRMYIRQLRNTLTSLELNSSPEDCGHSLEQLQNELENIAGKVNMAFDAVINALRNLTEPDHYPSLEADLETLLQKFILIRKQKAHREEIMHLWKASSFVWNLKPLVIELEGIREEIELKMKGL
jgi:uncharacterized membrane protein YccC